VVRVEHSFVVLNAGLKSEAYVPIDEFKNDQGELEVQLAISFQVAIDAVENGYATRSCRATRPSASRSWLSWKTRWSPASS